MQHAVGQPANSAAWRFGRRGSGFRCRFRLGGFGRAGLGREPPSPRPALARGAAGPVLARAWVQRSGLFGGRRRGCRLDRAWIAGCGGRRVAAWRDHGVADGSRRLSTSAVFFGFVGSERGLFAQGRVAHAPDPLRSKGSAGGGTGLSDSLWKDSHRRRLVRRGRSQRHSPKPHQGATLQSPVRCLSARSSCSGSVALCTVRRDQASCGSPGR